MLINNLIYVFSVSQHKKKTVINAPINEPPLPRRKKCPELAYRHHEFIADAGADKTDSNVTRARVSLIFCAYIFVFHGYIFLMLVYVLV